jgi:DNA polymerase III sliding clamp (beta) subunit (PCNA family)
MTDMLNLAEMEGELAPEILPVDARLSLRAPRSALLPLFERAAALTPNKEIVSGTMHALFEGIDADEFLVSHMRITASDGEQTISMRNEDPHVAVAGSVLLPAKRVYDILKLAPEGMVKIEVIGGSAMILAGRAQWTVAMPTGDSLPPFATVEDATYQDVPREAFLKAIGIVRKAVGQVFRPALMQADVANGAITMCDGARVHRQKVEGMPEDLTFTVPTKVLDELAKFLRASDDEHFSLAVSDTALAFSIGDDTLSAARLYLPFPNIENLILEPSISNPHSLTVSVQDLKTAIPRVRINADQQYANIFLMLVAGKKDSEGLPTYTLAIRARDPHNNAAQEIIDCQWSGPVGQRELCFNHKALGELLDVCQGETAIFKIGNDTKTNKNPLFVEDSAHGFTGVLQQMRSDWGK